MAQHHHSSPIPPGEHQYIIPQSAPAAMCRALKHDWDCGHSAVVIKETCPNACFTNGNQRCIRASLTLDDAFEMISISIAYPCPSCIRARSGEYSPKFGADAEGAYFARLSCCKLLKEHLQQQYHHHVKSYKKLRSSARTDQRLMDRNEPHVLLLEADQEVTRQFKAMIKKLEENLESIPLQLRPTFAPREDLPLTVAWNINAFFDETEEILHNLQHLNNMLDHSITTRRLLARTHLHG